MTGREMIKALQELGSENLDRDIVISEGSKYWTPYTVKVLKSKIYGEQRGNILID
jgi:hypothetical protein